MTDQSISDTLMTELRHKAEKRMAAVKSDGENREADEIARLIHELQVHQAELEMQNEELVKSREASDAAMHKYQRYYNKYAALFDFVPIGYLVVNRDGAILEINLCASIALDAPRSELIGRRITNFIHRDDQDGFYYQKLQCQGNLESSGFELRMKKETGAFFDARLQLQPIPAEFGDGPLYSLAITDISEQVRLFLDATLQQGCLELACTAEDLPALLRGCVRLINAHLRCDAAGICLCNGAGNALSEKFDGFSPEYYEAVSSQCLDTDPCTSLAVIMEATDQNRPFFSPNGSFYVNGISRFVATVAAADGEISRIVRRAQGYESIAMVPVVVEDVVKGMIHVADSHENRFPLRVVEALERVGARLGLAVQRFVLQEGLIRSRETLDELSKHLLTVQEDEQRRIAMELHDGAGQNLNVLKLRLKGLQNRLPADATDLDGECNALLALTDGLIDEIRNIAHGLKPSALEALGLVPATRQMIREFSTQDKVHVEKRIDLLDQIDDPTAQVCLYRIFQEALTNIHKHAEATWVLFTVRRDAETIHITIRDNGLGFDDRKKTDWNDDRKGMGLQAMELRCRMIGADLTIDSQPGKGTRLTICLPCPKKEVSQ